MKVTDLMAIAISMLLVFGGLPSYAQNVEGVQAGPPSAAMEDSANARQGGMKITPQKPDHNALVAMADNQTFAGLAVIEDISGDKLRVKVQLIDRAKIPATTDVSKPIALNNKTEVFDITVDADTRFYIRAGRSGLKVGEAYAITVDKPFKAAGKSGGLIALAIMPSALTANDFSKPLFVKTGN